MTGALRKPDWILVKAPTSVEAREIRQRMRSAHLHTVCEEAACPNMGECWKNRQATFLILGDTCTRACTFCNVRTGRPGAPDPAEPDHLADSAVAMGLRHVVITSVTRDDLPDGGAGQFAACVGAVRARESGATIEVLTPDFRNKDQAIETVVAARPDVYNHNIETVPRLYPSVRPGARYPDSLALLARVKALDSSIVTKSGMMVGLGETVDEVVAVMADLRAAGVEILTIGQYLQPTQRHTPVVRFVTPDEFDQLAERARALGFGLVSASPLTRSSHHAGADFERFRVCRGG